MIEKELALTSDFPPVDYDQWRARVEAELKGAPFEKKLVTRTLEGIDIQPLYTADDWPSDGDPSGFPGFLPPTRGSRVLGHAVAGWDIRQEHLHPDPAEANRAILEDLEHGVTWIQLWLDAAACAGLDADAREVAGFDVALIETVGVGQSETVVADMVDFFLVILIAGAGDELQGIKRGLIEMADLIAINKADGDNMLPAERARALYQNAMRLIHPADSSWIPPVLTCNAVENTGIDAIWSQVLKHRARFEPTGRFEQRRRAQMVHWMWDLVNEYIHRVLHEKPEVREVSARVEAAEHSGLMTAADGAESVIRAIGLG